MPEREYLRRRCFKTCQTGREVTDRGLSKLSHFHEKHFMEWKKEVVSFQDSMLVRSELN